jgi:fibronectin type 3 domain-containing protein
MEAGYKRNSRGGLKAMQNDLEVSVLDVYARKNEIRIKKKVMSKLFVGILVVSVLIGILTVIPEEVRAQTKESLPSIYSVAESTKDSTIDPQITKILGVKLPYPSSPQNLQSSPGDGYVVLSWDAPSSDGDSTITEYLIYRSTSYGNEVFLDSVTASRTSYKDTAVKNGQTYYYKVNAVNKEKEEGTFASTKATPVSSVTKPSVPQKLQASAGGGYVVLSWAVPSNDGGSAIVEYKIYRGTSSGGERYLDSASATTYRDTAVKNGETYYYYIVAVNVAGKSSPTDEVSAKPQGPPGSPRNVKAAAGDSYVKLEWIAPSDDGGSKITKYNIYRGTTSGGETLWKTVGKVLTYTDNDVTNDRTYYYQVSAVNSAGEGARSDEASAPPPAGITMPSLTHIETTPSAPQDFIATAGDRVVNLNWKAPVDDGGSAITEYTIYRGTSSDAESYLYSVSAPTISYTDRTVINDLIYYYKVSAENSVGEGEKSNEVDASPKSSLTETTAPLVTTPSAPLNFKASAGDGNVNLEWREPSDNGGSPITNYNIYRGTTPGGEALRGGVSNVLNYTDDIVINNQTYYYQVSAENSAGEGDMSDEASATLIPGETVPSAPQDLNADRGDEYVDLSWNPPSNDGGSPIMKYKVYRGMAPRGEEFVAEIDNAVNYRDYYVTNDRQYYYQVSAVNLPGEGEMSNNHYSSSNWCIRGNRCGVDQLPFL